MENYKIAVVAGDGIGPEVVASGIAIMDAAAGLAGEFPIEYVAAPAGARRPTWSAGKIFPRHHWRPATVPTPSCWAPAAYLTSGSVPPRTWRDGASPTPWRPFSHAPCWTIWAEPNTMTLPSGPPAGSSRSWRSPSRTAGSGPPTSADRPRPRRPPARSWLISSRDDGRSPGRAG